jgi:hypothetical protein
LPALLPLSWLGSDLQRLKPKISLDVEVPGAGNASGCSTWRLWRCRRRATKRVQHEVVVGPMPPFGDVLKTSGDLWKLIAFIRSVKPASMALINKPSAERWQE